MDIKLYTVTPLKSATAKTTRQLESRGHVIIVRLAPERAPPRGPHLGASAVRWENQGRQQVEHTTDVLCDQALARPSDDAKRRVRKSDVFGLNMREKTATTVGNVK